jgi:hypothetical protein
LANRKTDTKGENDMINFEEAEKFAHMFRAWTRWAGECVAIILACRLMWVVTQIINNVAVEIAKNTMAK